MGRLRIFLIDDQPLVRAGLKALVSDHPDIELINNKVDDTETVLDEIAATRPDVVVVDISDSGTRGVDLTARVRECCPSTKVVALSACEDLAHIQALLRAGATRHVPCRASAEDLIHAIKFAAGHGNGAPGAETPSPDGYGESRGHLSEREAQVLQLIAQGHSNKEIAVQLAVSAKTVETYKLRLMEKLDLHTRVDIVRYALQQGLLR